ncbi:MAG TPA: ABC transporter permease [Vicinamibacterales bacterium]|nr:ABC transporter permease [Vicinamibacterales bacterium]
MLQDLRYGLRLMARRPGFAAVAVATLALGIGTTTAIFAVTDRVLLRPVPYPDPGTLAVIWETPPNHPLPIMYASPPNLHEWQRRSRTFSAMGAFQWRDVTLGGNEPERVRSARVTAGLLPALGVRPRLGRLFLPEEDRANARPVAIISNTMWQRRFQQDPRILGRTIMIDGVPTEIVGVMPPGFVCPPAVVLRGTPPTEPAELWLPHATDLEAGQRGAHYLAVIGRLAPGAGVDGANREMNDIQAQIEREFPDYRGWRATVVPLVEQVTQSSRRAVGLLVAAVVFILLLACANVANLLLARGVGRRREYAIRSALGAGRHRLAMQVIAESLVLAITGGVAGLLLAYALVRTIVALGPATMPGLRDVQVDVRTAVFTLFASVAAAVLAGALPALGVVRARLASWLADRSGGAGGLRAQQFLAAGQIGLAVALLVTAALLVESFRQLRGVDTGFRPARVTTAKVTLPASRYPDAASRIRAADALVSSVTQLSGVEAAGMIDAVPLADNRQGTGFQRLDGPPADPSAPNTVNVAWITEGYFDAMGIPLLAGRPLTARDDAKSQPVVIINRRLARQVFGDENPIGRRVRVGNAAQLQFEVIAVVGDERHAGVATEATPSFFVPFRQVPNTRDLAIIVRSSSDAVPGLRDIVRRVDPDMPLFQVRTMAQVLDTSVAAPRAMAWLLSGFAFAALMLAAIGVFGVMSHAVSQRTREIGVRMAMGASPRRVLGGILGEGLMQVAFGLVAGAVLSLLTARLLSGLLFGVSALSITPYLVVIGLLATVSLIACLVPARRAMRIDPAVALRAD